MSFLLESLASASKAIYDGATDVFKDLINIKDAIGSHPTAKKVIPMIGTGLEYKPIVDSSLNIIQTINKYGLFLSQPQELKDKWENLSKFQLEIIKTSSLLAILNAVHGILLIKSPMFLDCHRQVVIKEIGKKVNESFSVLLEKKTFKAEDLSKIPSTILDWAMNLQLSGASHLNFVIKNRDKLAAVIHRVLSFSTT